MRIRAEALAQTAAGFAALADAYARSTPAELAADPEAAEVVRNVVASIEAFARARRAKDDAHARTALASALRAVYDRVRTGGGEGPESEAPPSRRTWHEGAWRTDEERRGAIARMIARSVPSLADDRSLTTAADLTPEQIEAHGGSRKAAEAVVAAVFAQRKIDETSLSGAVVFGLPLP